MRSRIRTIGSQSPPIISKSTFVERITFSPTKNDRNEIGNKYMKNFGKASPKHRSFSVASERKRYRYILEEEQMEIEELRKRIKVLKSSIANY